MTFSAKKQLVFRVYQEEHLPPLRDLFAFCRAILTTNRLLLKKNLSLDRKSTRLNSSHSQISYAVFCLKKKNSGADLSTTRSRVVVTSAGRHATTPCADRVRPCALLSSRLLTSRPFSTLSC